MASKVHNHSHWGYDAHNGPHTWAKDCENAAGSNQSPINIETRKAKFDDELVKRSLKVNVTTCKSATLLNTGHGFQVKLDCDAELSGGPLNSKYKFAQFHMHWGSDNAWGSEHTVNGVPGPGELHFVFWNSEKYSSVEEAVAHEDGLAVLGVILRTQGTDNTELEPLFKHFNAIQQADARVERLAPINIQRLLPFNTRDYYTYQGSLTTPPCNECVTWIVFKDSVGMSAHQLAQCRKLRGSKNSDAQESILEETFRTTCPLGKRVIRKTFK